MSKHIEMSDSDLRRAIKNHEVCLGGNKNLKIYGKLNCKSGKRMNRENRVFFRSTVEAIDHGYRPCGNCLKSEYTSWKKLNGFV
jgi:methylphosphotriester-DNA--protein-cysteine methyltransferase